ncbi:hypothetical protein D3C83_270620 [compost metagenome]
MVEKSKLARRQQTCSPATHVSAPQTTSPSSATLSLCSETVAGIAHTLMNSCGTITLRRHTSAAS